MGPETDRHRAGNGIRGVAVACLACGRLGVLDGDSAAAALPLVQLTRRLRCSECGSRAVRVRRGAAAGPQKAVEAARERLRHGTRPSRRPDDEGQDQ